MMTSMMTLMMDDSHDESESPLDSENSKTEETRGLYKVLRSRAQGITFQW
jgi:hypothetical protein